MTRQQKTPRQRAEEQLAIANRAVVRLDRKVDDLTTQLAVLRREQTAAIARRDHLATHPDLQHNPTTSTGATA